MDDIQGHKAACRKAAFAARKQAHGMGLDAKANAQLLSYCKGLPDDTIIAGYMPIRTELSPLIAMRKLCQRGFVICVPVVLGADQPLEFHRWTNETEMIDGAFGAAIPKHADQVVPDVVITPMVAFDHSGYRLGYGGGFYDRSFAQITRQKSVQAIGFAYSAQEVMLVPREKTDYPLDGVITELGILRY